MLVYIAHNKDTLDMIAENIKRIICDDPILIIKVGSDSLHYFKKD